MISRIVRKSAPKHRFLHVFWPVCKQVPQTRKPANRFSLTSSWALRELGELLSLTGFILYSIACNCALVVEPGLGYASLSGRDSPVQCRRDQKKSACRGYAYCRKRWRIKSPPGRWSSDQPRL